MEEYLTVSDLSDQIKYSKFAQYSLQGKISGWKALTMVAIRRR